MTEPTTEQIAEALDNEIRWCEKNGPAAFATDYRKGFINGLRQAQDIIGEMKRALRESQEGDAP